jgi:hypothetical protein
MSDKEIARLNGIFLQLQKAEDRVRKLRVKYSATKNLLEALDIARRNKENKS